MKLLHFSDLHIGVENYGRVDPQTGLSARLQDFLDTYDQVLEFAIQQHVDLVLFCGDAYKSREPSQTHQRAFARGIARLSQAGIGTFLVLGNHDLPATTSRASAMDIFPTLHTPGVTIGSTVRAHLVETPSGPIQIVALPWVRRAEFASHQDVRARSVEEVNRFIEQRLAAYIEDAAHSLNPDIPAILAGHCTVAGSITSSEQSMMLGRDHVLLQSSLSLPSFDYVALGHIHRRQVLGHSPPIVYPGSLQRIDFGEEKDTKGFYLVEMDPTAPLGQRLLDYTFHPVDARAFLTIPVAIEEDDPDPTQTIVDAIQKQDIREKVVRVAVTLPRHLEGMLNERRVQQALQDAFFITPIQRNVLGERRSRWQGEALHADSPMDALARYLETRQGMSQERKRLLLDHAQELLEEPEP